MKYSAASSGHVIPNNSKHKKKEDRSHSQHFYPSPKKTKKLKNSSSNLQSGKTIILPKKQQKSQRFPNVKIEYDKSRFVLYLSSYYNEHLNLEGNNTISEVPEFPSSQGTTPNLQSTNPSQVQSQARLQIYKKQSAPTPLSFNRNDSKQVYINKVNYIIDLRNRNYLQGLFVHKRRKLHLYKQFLSIKILSEIADLLSSYINTWLNIYLSKTGQKDGVDVFDHSLSPITIKNLGTNSNNNSGMFGNILYTNSRNDDYSTNPMFNNNYFGSSNNYSKKNKTKGIQIQFSVMKTELTPFPKKKEKTIKDDILYSKASGAANLIRRIEYSNYLKSSKVKYSKETLTKNAIKIQRWWRRMLQNNTFYYKIMQIQKMWRGYLTRISFSSAKIYYFKIIPLIKKILFVWYKNKFESMYNYLLSNYALLYKYKKTEEGIQLIKYNFDIYINRNQSLLEEIEINKIRFKNYVHLKKYFTNISKYKFFLRKIIFIQKTYRRYQLNMLIHKNALIKGVYFTNNKIQEMFVKYQLNKLITALKRNNFYSFINRMKLYNKNKIKTINKSKKTALNKLFQKYRIKSSFQEMKYKIRLIKFQSNMIKYCLSNIISKISFHDFLNKLILHIKTKNRKKCLLKCINIKNNQHKSKWFDIYIKNSLNRNIQTNEIYNKEQLVLIKFITKKEFLCKMHSFKQWEKVLSKYNVSRYYSGLLIIKNIFLKKLAIYFSFAKTIILRGKQKKLKRITRIFTNDNSKIYFVSEKSVIHAKLKKIVRNCDKMNKMILKLYLLKYAKNCVIYKPQNIITTPSRAFVKPKVKNASFSSLSRVKKQTDDALIAQDNQSILNKKIILKSLINQKKKLERMTLCKYFMKWKTTMSNCKDISIKEMKLKMIYKIRIIKEFCIKLLFMKYWRKKVKEKIIIQNVKFIQNCFVLLGPYKLLCISLKIVILNHFFKKFKQFT